VAEVVTTLPAVQQLPVRPGLHAVIGDVHRPDHDAYAVDLAVDFLRRNKPVALHLLGDVVDCLPVSRFPFAVDRLDKLQEDLDGVATWLRTLRRLLPDGTHIYYAEGNHESRIARYVRSRAQALETLRALTIPELLGLDALRVQWFPESTAYRIGHLTFTHGLGISKHSGWSARKALERVGQNVIVGDCHRLGTYHVSNWDSDICGWENGCFQNLSPEWCNGPQNWQHGFTAITFRRDGLFQAEPIRIIRQHDEPPCYFWRGQLIRWSPRMSRS
jgi:hypothetical protein